jgi:DNA-binding XRE family transcriptional regulator
MGLRDGYIEGSSEAGAKCPILGAMKKPRKAPPAFTRSPNDSPEKRKARGARILWAREIVEPNRTDFARKLGVDVTTIRNIEDGKTNPGLQLAHKIFHTLRISLIYVVEGKPEGVDPELAAILVADHPELAPPRQSLRRSGNPDIAPQTSTSATINAAPAFSG